MKKIIIILTILLLCGCEAKLKFEDTNEYTYINNNRDKVNKFVVQTVTLLGRHCYEVDKTEGLNVLDNLKIEAATNMYETDSDMYYDVYFEDGIVKSFKFNVGNLVYKGNRYKLNNFKEFILSTENEIDCHSEKINHNLIKNNINNEYNLYYYEIDNVYINLNNKEIDLAEALLNKEISIGDLVSKLEVLNTYYDGGTILYKTNQIFKEELELLKCKTLDGNQDIYIGKIGMGYHTNFCIKDNHTFTKTYTINKISDYKGQQYENGIPVSYSRSLKVSLSDFAEQKNDVIINNYLEPLEVGKTYEFEFMLYDSLLDDSPENIFKKAIIVNVKETDKVGKNQINDLAR